MQAPVRLAGVSPGDPGGLPGSVGGIAMISRCDGRSIAPIPTLPDSQFRVSWCQRSRTPASCRCLRPGTVPRQGTAFPARFSDRGPMTARRTPGRRQAVVRGTRPCLDGDCRTGGYPDHPQEPAAPPPAFGTPPQLPTRTVITTELGQAAEIAARGDTLSQRSPTGCPSKLRPASRETHDAGSRGSTGRPRVNGAARQGVMGVIRSDGGN